MKTVRIGKLLKNIQDDTKYSEDYNTGLIGENIIVSSYKQMPLDKLEKVRYIINQIIKKKKEYRKVNDANDNKKE